MVLEQYRKTSDELNRAKMTLGELESQLNNFKQELQIKEADMKRSLERSQYLENELQKVKTFK